MFELYVHLVIPKLWLRPELRVFSHIVQDHPSLLHKYPTLYKLFSTISGILPVMMLMLYDIANSENLLMISLVYFAKFRIASGSDKLLNGDINGALKNSGKKQNHICIRIQHQQKTRLVALIRQGLCISAFAIELNLIEQLFF